MNLNQVNLIGRVTKQPETRALPSGGSVVSFSLATNRTWKDKEGGKKEEVEFHNVVAFGKVAEIIGQYVQKGQLIYIQGRLQTRTWDGQDGKKNYRTEIICENMQMGPRAGNSPARSEGSGNSADIDEAPAETGEISIDDIPF